MAFHKLIAENRRAKFDYFLEDALEAEDERCCRAASRRALAAQGIGDLLCLGERCVWRHLAAHA